MAGLRCCGFAVFFLQIDGFFGFLDFLYFVWFVGLGGIVLVGFMWEWLTRPGGVCEVRQSANVSALCLGFGRIFRWQTRLVDRYREGRIGCLCLRLRAVGYRRGDRC